MIVSLTSVPEVPEQSLVGHDTCTIIIAHLSSLAWLMFDAIKDGGSGGEAPAKAGGFEEPPASPMSDVALTSTHQPPRLLPSFPLPLLPSFLPSPGTKK